MLNEKLIFALLAELLSAVCEAPGVYASPSRLELIEKARIVAGTTLRGELIDNEGCIWKIIRYGALDEGVKVLREIDGVLWTGWVTFNDLQLFKEGKSSGVSVSWAKEV